MGTKFKPLLRFSGIVTTVLRFSGDEWLEVHSKLMTNPALLKALADDAKLDLSFTTPTKYRDPSNQLRSLITSCAPMPMSSIA